MKTENSIPNKNPKKVFIAFSVRISLNKRPRSHPNKRLSPETELSNKRPSLPLPANFLKQYG